MFYHKFNNKKFFTVVILLFSFFILVGCKKDKESLEKLYLSALESYSVREFDKALFYLKGATEIDRNNSQVNFLIAKINFFQQNYEQCLLLLNKVIKQNPEFTEARIWLIRCEIVNKNYESAKARLDDELKWNMTDWRIFYLYSLLSKEQDKLDEQLVMLKNAELSLQDASKVYASTAMTWSILGIESKEKEYINKAKVIGNFSEVDKNEE